MQSLFAFPFTQVLQHNLTHERETVRVCSAFPVDFLSFHGVWTIFYCGISAIIEIRAPADPRTLHGLKTTEHS